ncbi:Gfo/Idh/MocA family protein, partial [Microbispora sp. H10836]|uniref:Gfo/Idh/MocA family protein n=1 Tax=Microbispora sp. H10836 TaxID=2729106 RepID=UPI0014758740
RFVEQGRLGEIRHVRAQYLQDWIVDPEFPLVWRLQKDKAGSGALGDIGAHIIDTAEFITGERLVGVSALTETFVKERPLAASSAGLSAGGGAGRGTVTVDDAALFLGRLSGGGLASFEATRFATGHKNALRIEVNGSLGSLSFDFESMNELWFHDHTIGSAEHGFRRVQVTEADHPYAGAWWPPGHGLGYEHTFTHEVKDFIEAVAAGTDP